MRVVKSTIGWGLFGILFVICWGVGPHEARANESSANAGDSRYSVKLQTPALKLAYQPDGFYGIEIEGFETRSRRLGAPDIPSATLLIAIPPEATPRLEVRSCVEQTRAGVRPRPVPRAAFSLAPEQELELADDGLSGERRLQILRGASRPRFEADARIYEGETPHPEQLAWLGSIGILRDQRYVELHLAPVRFDPGLGGLRVCSSLEAIVHFDGATSSRPAPSATDPLFERVYREAFENYGQGRKFRLLGERAAPVPSTSLSSSRSSGREGESGPRQRIRVDAHGRVRLDHTKMASTAFLAHAISTWRLTNRGVQVPLEILDDGDDILEPGEWVQFYGQALDDEPKTVLNTDFPNTEFDLYEARDFTDVNVYFLEVDAQAQPPMALREAAPTGTRTPPDHFAAVAHEEVDDAFRPFGGADPWYWSPTLLAGPSSGDGRTDSVALPGLYSGTEPVDVRVHVQGRTTYTDIDPDHLTRVTLFNSTDDVLEVHDGQFDSLALYLDEFSWSYPGSGPQLTGPARIDVEALPVSGANNQFILDFIEVTYRRAFLVENGSLSFDWPDEDAEFVVGGLQDAAPAVYEITLADGEEVIQPVRLDAVEVSVTGPPYEVRFRIDEDPAIADGSPRSFLVAADSAATYPSGANFLPDTISDLRDNANQADLIVIAHPDALDPSPTGPLAQLLDHHATLQGGGLTSKVALLEDVEDEFNHGLPGTPAIREFLRWVLSSAPGEGWANPRPAYVLLLGDGSYDYKGTVDPGNLVPTQIMFKQDPILGHYTSDSLLGAVVGDDSLPDLVIGRVPARSTSEAAGMLQKALTHDQAPPAGEWQQRALFLSDRGKTGNNPGEALEFELTNGIGASYIQAPPYIETQLRYYSNFYDNPDVTDPIGDMTDAIWSEVNGPSAAVLQFIGHGNYVVWSDDAFFDERLVPRDSDGLTNGNAQPWLMAHNCLTGGFYAGEFTMGEDWLRRAGGGAAGVFSPSGLSFNFIGRKVTEELWGEMFGPAKERRVAALDQLTRVTLCGQGSIEACQQYVMLGDPAMRLALHSVDPPTSLQAVSGDARVDLNWIESATPSVHYDIYRVEDPSPYDYEKINPSPVTGSTYADTDVENARDYLYYAIAVDPEGFESRWSNFNSDCDQTGIDCVRATPWNPDPPTRPTGLSVTDPGTGNALRVSWSPNPETDIAGYSLHYGIESTVYGTVEDLDKTTTVLVTGLDENQIYFFALSATNTSAKVSALSDEVADYPVLAPGLRPPAFIDDLTVTTTATDVLLEWSEVLSDAYGKPLQVAIYEVLRGSSADYSNGSLVKIGECSSPCSAYADPGAAIAPTSYHYRVRAVDAEGTGGGVGAEPPRGTELWVMLSDITPGDLSLSWDPVVETLAGTPVELLHYAIYASDTPFGAAEVRDGLVPVLQTTTGTTWELSPQPQDRYYSVFAVDTRGNVSPF